MKQVREIILFLVIFTIAHTILTVAACWMAFAHFDSSFGYFYKRAASIPTSPCIYSVFSSFYLST